MIRRFPLAWRCLPFLCLPAFLSFLACASPAGGGGSGGSTGNGGSGTGGSSTGSGGSGDTLPDFLSHGPYPFPQSKTSGSCTLTSNGNAASATQSAYNSWKGTFVTASGASSGLRVQDPTQNANCNGTTVSNRTVSEGMGYGMLAAVYMNDKSTFDGMLAYVNTHLDANGLMNWCISSSGTTAGSGSASDADEDMAFALLMAAAQWSSTDYYDAGKAMVNAMYGHSLGGDGSLYPGDTGGANGLIYPDYFSPAYYRVFAKVGSSNWGGAVITHGYSILATVGGTNGLVPNSTNNNSPSQSGTYGYDSCRAPWRIAMDYCFNGSTDAKTYLDKIGPFFSNIGAANIGDGYTTTTGAQTQGNHNMAFIGPAGTAGMAGYQTLLDGAFTFGVNGAGDSAYFTNSLRVVTMLMMSGNLLDYSQR